MSFALHLSRHKQPAVHDTNVQATEILITAKGSMGSVIVLTSIGGVASAKLELESLSGEYREKTWHIRT